MGNICLICGKKLSSPFICSCGYDETKNYDSYRTLAGIDANVLSAFQRRQNHEGSINTSNNSEQMINSKDNENIEAELQLFNLFTRALKDDADACADLGDIYSKGGKFQADLKLAREFYMKAVNHGHANAMARMGIIAEQVDKDLVAAKHWYERAVTRDNPLGKYRLAIMYDKGIGVDKDAKNALKLYKEAAEAGNGPAMRMFAGMYLDGRAGEKNEKLAMNWMEKAADTGDYFAMRILSRAYEFGDYGVGIDLDKARQWELKAAESSTTGKNSKPFGNQILSRY